VAEEHQVLDPHCRDGNSLSGSTSDDAQPALIADNDVLVKVGSSYFDATKDPGGACSAT